MKNLIVEEYHVFFVFLHKDNVDRATLISTGQIKDFSD